MGHASGRIGIIAGAMVLTLLSRSAVAMPHTPVVVGPNNITHTMFVCDGTCQ